MSQFSRLFQPGKIGRMEVRNRIVMPAMSTRFCDPMGAVTQREVDYFAERARGGAGLIIVGSVFVNRLGAGIGALRIDGDQYIGGLSEITRAVHLWGGKVGIQLTHFGTLVRAHPDARLERKGKIPVSASKNPVPGTKEFSRALSVVEIKEVEDDFGEAARRAKLADFDVIELNAGHGHLIGQFLSRRTNRRKDAYGGGLDGRTRFATEIINQVKEKVGSDFPIMCRISGDEFVKNGINLDEAKAIARKFEQAEVNCVSVSVGVSRENPAYLAPMAIPRGHYVYLAEGVKKAVGIPVVASCRINDPLLAEKILAEEKADFIAMGRPLVADPELPRKASEGRLDEIRMCMACNDGCVTITRMGKPYLCTLNAAVGHERDCEIKQAEHRKRILVVGGGPGGLETARVAALRGHEVLLFEKSDQLGGQLLLGAAAPHSDEINHTIRYYTKEAERLGVKITLNTEVSPSTIDELRPDAVVIATGATPLIPKIQGICRENVVAAWEVLRGSARVNSQKVAVLGGGLSVAKRQNT